MAVRSELPPNIVTTSDNVGFSLEVARASQHVGQRRVIDLSLRRFWRLIRWFLRAAQLNGAYNEGTIALIRKDNRMDSFQRQVSALRQQLSSDAEDDVIDDAEPMPLVPDTVRQQAPTPISMLGHVSPEAHTQWLGGDPEVGVIATGSHWNGTMRSDGSLRIHGHAEGELYAARSIFVAEGAVVSARISSNHIVIAGAVDGTVDCTGRLEILPTGRVSGDVSAPTLIVHDGATMTGQLKMRASTGNAA
ncbi:MAG: polymer-forming cytoskeletal protein [Chloroflexi bacterium]|nr:MAG: polymer-forming cytoskeletal protein [Chloroflexota bacterium]